MRGPPMMGGGGPMGGGGGGPPDAMMQQMMRECNAQGIDPHVFMQFMQQQGAMPPGIGPGMNGGPMMGPPPHHGGGSGGGGGGGIVGGGRGPPGPGGQWHSDGGVGNRGGVGGDRNRGGGNKGGGGGAGAGAGVGGQPQAAEQLSGQKRPLSDISNDQPELVPGTLLQNESAQIDIKEDHFFAGPYKQERNLVFDVEPLIEEAEIKDTLTVGDRTGKPHMCPW